MNSNLRKLSSHFHCYSSLVFSKLTNVETRKFFPSIYSFRRCIVSSSVLQKKKVLRSSIQKEVIEDEEEDVRQYNQLVHRAQLLPDSGHQVLIIQPYVKWGPKKKELTTPDLMLEEAKALIDSLPNWTCVNAIKVPTETLAKKRVFGKGKFDDLKEQIRKDIKISAVFVSINILNGVQKKELESEFRVPIFDRYSIVLQIFKVRAQTYEAKLQVSLAEIPYLRTALRSLQKGGGEKEGETYQESQLQLLSKRELKIKAEIESMQKKRSLLKQQRKKKEYPVVAVLGYTNSGKTTLIKRLTGDGSIEPKDALFATLDVTAHECRLPCNLSILLIDTVGFISDIPTSLIGAFKSTLRDAIDADVLLHVQDVSNPDRENQIATVNSTLLSLDTSLPPYIISVANKIDKLSDNFVSEHPEILKISAQHGTGCPELLQQLQITILAATNRQIMTFKVPNGGQEYMWLNSNSAVLDCSADPSDEESLNMEVVITMSALGKFKTYFPRVKSLLV